MQPDNDTRVAARSISGSARARQYCRHQSELRLRITRGASLVRLASRTQQGPRHSRIRRITAKWSSNRARACTTRHRRSRLPRRPVSARSSQNTGRPSSPAPRSAVATAAASSHRRTGRSPHRLESATAATRSASDHHPFWRLRGFTSHAESENSHAKAQRAQRSCSFLHLRGLRQHVEQR